MTRVTLKAVVEIESPERQVVEWGDRLLKSYRLTVDVDYKEHLFVWVMAVDRSNTPCPEYDDDFEEFLIEVCGTEPFKKCRSFINEIQEKFSLAVHNAYSGTEIMTVHLPFTIVR